MAYIRKGNKTEDDLIVICNMTPMVREDYRIGLPGPGSYREIFNSDDQKFGGSGVVSTKRPKAEEIPWHNREYSLAFTLPPLGVKVLKRVQSKS